MIEKMVEARLRINESILLSEAAQKVRDEVQAILEAEDKGTVRRVKMEVANCSALITPDTWAYVEKEMVQVDVRILEAYQDAEQNLFDVPLDIALIVVACKMNYHNGEAKIEVIES